MRGRWVSGCWRLPSRWRSRFPWTSVVVEDGWLLKNRELAYRYMKCAAEAIVTFKRNRADSERTIAKYMKISDPKLIATEFDFVSSLMPDYMAPTLEGLKVILENFGKEYPDAPKRDPKEFADGSIIERIEAGEIAEGLKFWASDTAGLKSRSEMGKMPRL